MGGVISVLRIFSKRLATEPFAMGGQFGNLGVTLRGVIHYRISPYEIRPFGGLMSRIPQWVRRIREEIFVVGTPMVTCAMICAMCEIEYQKTLRKNPKDFENDV